MTYLYGFWGNIRDNHLYNIQCVKYGLKYQNTLKPLEELQDTSKFTRSLDEGDDVQKDDVNGMKVSFSGMSGRETNKWAATDVNNFTTICCILHNFHVLEHHHLHDNYNS